MCWLKRDTWKVGIALAGLLLFLVLMLWVPMSAAAYEGASGLAPTLTVTVTPTVDATVTALSKEQLTLQVKQLQNQLQNQNNWLANNSTALIAAFAAIVVALFGISQWAVNRRDERRKEVAAHEKESRDRQIAQDKDLRAQAEERFKTAVIALGDEKEAVQVSGAILLRSFLNPDDKEIYGRYYTQIFDLAVANLRPSGTSQPSGDSDTPLPLTTLRQALIVVFKEAFPLARPPVKRSPQPPRVFGARPQLVTTGIQSLDASSIQLDNAYLASADLKQAWMGRASLRGATLIHDNLSEANLGGVDLRGVLALRADLRQAYLMRAKLNRAELNWANLSGAKLMEADLRGTRLNEADLSEAELCGADLSRTFLVGADLTDTNIEDAKSLKGTLLGANKGLTKEKRAYCKIRGAIVDEDTTTSPSQPPVSPPATSQSSDAQAPQARLPQWSLLPPNKSGGNASVSQQSNNAQAPAAIPDQASIASPDTGGSNTTSSKSSPGT